LKGIRNATETRCSRRILFFLGRKERGRGECYGAGIKINSHIKD